METFRLHMVTWNVCTAAPPNDVSSLLHLFSPKTPDLYVIGLQEVKAGPLKFVADLAFDDSWSHLLMSTLAPRGYIKVCSVRMQGLLLLLFSRLAHVPFIRDVEATYTRTGIFGYWGNKGAVAIRVSFYGHTMCFLNCHLAAHMRYANERVDEFEYILERLTLNPQRTPKVLDHRLVFWFGDLNFRIADHDMHFLRSAINDQQFSLLWEKDQLMMMKKKEAFLQEFQEGPLDFQPTYKFDRFSDNYDSSGKKRKPAWTDRILWRVSPETGRPKLKLLEGEPGTSEGPQERALKEEDEFPLKVTQDLYSSTMEYRISDHKPVYSSFSLELKKKYESPLVRLSPTGDWSADMDAMVTYSPIQPFPSSSWDWIGLYKIGFKSVSDYITYTWVKDNVVSFNDELIQVYMSKEEIPVLGGECILCYYCSALQCIVGISSPFKVQESKAAIEEGLMPENIDGFEKLSVGSN